MPPGGVAGAFPPARPRGAPDRRGDVLQPVAHRACRRRAGAGRHAGGQPARGRHRQALAQRLRARRQAVAAVAGGVAARRPVRGPRPPLHRRPHAGRLRRGEPRLGRRVRGLPRPHRAAALPPPVQLPHLGGGHRRQRGGLRHERRARGGGADVLRLHGPRRRRDPQPDGQVAGDVRRRAAAAAGAAGVGGQPLRRAALAGLVLAADPHPRPEGVLSGDSLRCQGDAQLRPAGHRSGDLLREPAPVRLRRGVRGRRRAGGLLRGGGGPAGAAPRGRRPHHRDHRRHAVSRAGGRRRAAGGPRPERRGVRRPVSQPAGPGADRRVGAQDRAPGAGVRRLRPRQLSAHRGLQPDPALLRGPGRAAGGGGRAQLDHPRRRAGAVVLSRRRSGSWTPSTRSCCRWRDTPALPTRPAASSPPGPAQGFSSRT